MLPVPRIPKAEACSSQNMYEKIQHVLWHRSVLMERAVHLCITVLGLLLKQDTLASYADNDMLQLTSTCDSLNWLSMEAVRAWEAAQSTSCSSADLAAWVTVLLSHCKKSTSGSSAVSKCQQMRDFCRVRNGWWSRPEQGCNTSRQKKGLLTAYCQCCTGQKVMGAVEQLVH